MPRKQGENGNETNKKEKNDTDRTYLPPGNRPPSSGLPGEEERKDTGTLHGAAQLTRLTRSTRVLVFFFHYLVELECNWFVSHNVERIA